MTFKDLCRTYGGKSIQDDGAYNSVEMKKFGRDFKSALRDFCKKNMYELCSCYIGHYFVSAFIQNDNKYIYISFDVPRGGYTIDVNARSPLFGVLYREAENEKDYKGKQNHFTSLAELENALLLF